MKNAQIGTIKPGILQELDNAPVQMIERWMRRLVRAFRSLSVTDFNEKVNSICVSPTRARAIISWSRTKKPAFFNVKSGLSLYMLRRAVWTNARTS